MTRNASLPSVASGAASRALAPQALQQNDGAQFVEYNAACSTPLGQVSRGTALGSMWFTIPAGCNNGGGQVGRVEILTGAVKQFKLGPAAMPVAAASSGGYVWIADQTEVGGKRSMYRFNEDGSYATFALPKAIVVSDLVAGRDGNVWFVGAFPSGDTTKAGIGNMSPSGVGTLYPVTGAAPPVLASLASASNGDLWATDEQNGRLLDVTVGGKITPYAVGGHPHRITNSGHSLVYSDGKARQLSVITGGVAKVYPAPSGEYPGQLASRTDGTVVFIDRTDNNAAVNTFDPTGAVYGTKTRAPNAGLRFLFTGPDRNTWFTDNYGHIGAYLKFDLSTNPSSIALSSTTCTASFQANETNYTGTLTVQSQNGDVATVTPSSGPSGTKFSVSSRAVGATTIFVVDSMQNAVNVPVTVSNTCGNPDCPALSGGTGILEDGDFSQDVDVFFQTYDAGQIVAPNFIVTQANVDFYGSTTWGGQVPGDLCSIDLDGSPGAGGIASQELATVSGATYTVSFYFSGNTVGPPDEKVMLVSAAGQSQKFDWHDAGGGAQQGVWALEQWQFTATGASTTLAFTSEDANATDYGPVIAGIAVVKSASDPSLRAGRTRATYHGRSWTEPRVVPSP